VTSGDRRLRVVYALSADDWIVERVTKLSHQQAITVVTSDRLLRDRVRRAGGTILSPRQFLAACPEPTL
jgi:rRNA-processing protein FCF1